MQWLHGYTLKTAVLFQAESVDILCIAAVPLVERSWWLDSL
jgi:hypothetical protein